MNDGQNRDPDIEKLMNLLKKILNKDPRGAEQFQKMLGSKNFNLNLCFVTFFPLCPEEAEELSEFYEEAAGCGGMPRHRDAEPDLEFKLTRSDIEFLKKNGLHFE